MEKELEKFGYTAFFETNRKKLGLGDFSIARVIAEHKGAYVVTNEHGEFFAKVTGKKMFDAVSREDYPAVGDWVAITEHDAETATIHAILPRRTIIKRKYGDKNRSGEKMEIQIIGTNIDVAFVVESTDRDYNLNRFERYFTLAKDGGVTPAIVLNKTDLIPKEELDSILVAIKKRFPATLVVPTSVVNEEGLHELKAHILPGKTYCFLGSSGVGKSSLINTLIGEKLIKTGTISSYSDRGTHVTTSREMYFLENGGIVVDNPGMREVGMTDVKTGVEDLFDEIIVLTKSCKYADCTHIHEPDCAVTAAVRSGALDEDRYNNYIRLKKEVTYSEMSSFEKRKKDREFGKFIKKAKKEIKRYKE